METLKTQSLVYVGMHMLVPYSMIVGIPYLYGTPVAFDQESGKHYLFPLHEGNKFSFECVELTPEKVLELRFSFENLSPVEYSGPKEWKAIFEKVRNPDPYTFDDLNAHARSWTNEWLWIQSPAPYIPSALGFMLDRKILHYLEYPQNDLLGWDFYTKSFPKRTLEDVFGDIQVRDFDDRIDVLGIPGSGDYKSDYLLGFVPVENIEAFERKVFKHLSVIVNKLLSGIVNEEGRNQDEHDMERSIMFNPVSEILDSLSFFENSPDELEQVLLREVLLESYRWEDPLIEVRRTPLEKLQERMHKWLPTSSVFQTVESLRKARDELEEKLRDPSYFKK